MLELFVIGTFCELIKIYCCSATPPSWCIIYTSPEGKQVAEIHEFGKIKIVFDPKISYDAEKYDPQKRLLLLAPSRLGMK